MTNPPSNSDPLKPIDGHHHPRTVERATTRQALETRMVTMRPVRVRPRSRLVDADLHDIPDIVHEGHDREMIRGGGASGTQDGDGHHGEGAMQHPGEASTPFAPPASVRDGEALSEATGGVAAAANREQGQPEGTRNGPTPRGTEGPGVRAGTVASAAPQPSTVDQELATARDAFMTRLGGESRSVLSNGAGLFTPLDGPTTHSSVDGVVAFAGVRGSTPSQPRDGYCGVMPQQQPRRSCWGWLAAAALGLGAVAAFTPMMFGAPFMGAPFMMSGMMVPMMSMMSFNMMNAMNMCMPNPMMGCMPFAMGSAPYQFPMSNPWTTPPGAGPWGQQGGGPWGQQSGPWGQQGGPWGQQSGPWGAPQGPSGAPQGPWGAPRGPVSSNRPNGMPSAPPVPRSAGSGPSTLGMNAMLANGPVASLTEEQQARLAAMPPERQAAFLDLFNHYKGADLILPGCSQPMSVSTALGKLLTSGRLDVRDRDGNDMLTNLVNLKNQPMARGIDSDLFTAQAVVQTALPARTMTTGAHNACAPATVEYMLARKNPAEYVRLASGLASPQGQVALATGQVATRPADAIQEDNSGRSQLSRLMQSSFMNYEGAEFKEGSYSNLRDQFEPPSTPGWNPFAKKPAGPQGLSYAETEDLTSSVLGEKFVEFYKQGDDPQQGLALLAHAARPGTDGVSVSMQYGTTAHRVVVGRVEDGRVYFRNPLGNGTQDKPVMAIPGLDHQIMPDGLESLPVDQFMANMKSAAAAESALQP